MFKVEKGVPLPVGGRGRSRGQLRLAIETMEVGDSMVIPVKLRDRVPNIMSRLKFGYTTRKVDAQHCRIWRVK